MQLEKDNWAEWRGFEREVIEIAATFAQLRKCSVDHIPLREVIRDLKIIDKALTVALQKLAPLELEHQGGQDISTRPFNSLVVQALWQGRDVIKARQANMVAETVAYPTEIIEGLRELRDVTRKAIELNKQGRGNSTHRDPKSLRRASLAKNFVFRYRSRFGSMPPVSRRGPVVDLMEKMFVVAGEDDETDAYELLRQAIKKDEVGRELFLRSERRGK